MQENSADIGGKKLSKHTVRFTDDVWSVICEIAERNGTTAAELVRHSVDKNLDRYLSRVYFIDHNDFEAFHRDIHSLITEIEKIRLELNRIGVNFNQQVRLKQLEKKKQEYEDKYLFVKAMDCEKEKRDILNKADLLNKKELENLMCRFENAAVKVSDLICHIHG